MPASRDKGVTRQRVELAWEMYRKGEGPSAIAQAIEQAGLGRISRQAAYKIVQKMAEEVFDQLREEAAAEKLRQLDRLETVYREAWRAWGETRKPQKETRTRKIGKAVEKTIIIREGTGDPRHLANALRAMGDMRKILGINGDPGLNEDTVNENEYEEARKSWFRECTAAELNWYLKRHNEFESGLCSEVVTLKAQALLLSRIVARAEGAPQPPLCDWRAEQSSAPVIASSVALLPGPPESLPPAVPDDLHTGATPSVATPLSPFPLGRAELLAPPTPPKEGHELNVPTSEPGKRLDPKPETVDWSSFLTAPAPGQKGLLARVRAMTDSELKGFFCEPGNRQRYEEALREEEARDMAQAAVGLMDVGFKL